MTDDLKQRLRTHGNMGNKWSMMLSHEAADRIGQLESERDELKAAIELYEQALMASWPEGAMGDAYEYWNAARAAIAKGDK